MRKRCYYEVLELSLAATLCEIRHSYHKLAMKWHPDKNKSLEAKDHFQEINEAYSILNNASEKSWYDRHREVIIRNWNLRTPESTEISKDETMLTCGGSYWPYFVRPAFLGYDDSESGFYTVYRNVFDVINDGVEEMNALVSEFENTNLNEDGVDMSIVRAPSFGDSETKLVEVVQFYYYWDHLVAFVESAWINLCYLDLGSELRLEDRNQRANLMKRFIDLIRDLVEYVKLKDPRYLLYLQNNSIANSEEETKENHNICQDIVPKMENKEQKVQILNRNRPNRIICMECWKWSVSHLKHMLQTNIPNLNEMFLQTQAHQITPKPISLETMRLPAIELANSSLQQDFNSEDKEQMEEEELI